jgi:hypothetical protein
MGLTLADQVRDLHRTWSGAESDNEHSNDSGPYAAACLGNRIRRPYRVAAYARVRFSATIAPGGTGRSTKRRLNK